MLKQLFQTTDGKVFENKEEAQIHQDKINPNPKIYEVKLLTKLHKLNLLTLNIHSHSYTQQRIDTIEALKEFCFVNNTELKFILPIYQKIIWEHSSLNKEFMELENCLSKLFNKMCYSQKEQESAMNNILNPIKNKWKIFENCGLDEFFDKQAEINHVIKSMIKQSYVMMDFFV